MVRKNREKFVKAISLYQNLYASIDTRNRLLEKAFGEDSEIIDFRGLDELKSVIVDLVATMFHKLDEKSIGEDLDWYLYELPNLPEEAHYFEHKGTKYGIKNSGDLFDYWSKNFK